MADKFGIVYVLTNPAMPGIVKIGMTLRNEVSSRMKELYGTGVPLPFNCEYACTVESDRCEELEKALHMAFNPYRLNANREFFSIEPYQVISVLKLFDKNAEEVTDEVSEDIASGLEASELCTPENNEVSRLPFNHIPSDLSASEMKVVEMVLDWLNKYEDDRDKVLVRKLSDGYLRFSFSTRWWPICRIKVRWDGSLNVKICKQALTKNSESTTLPDIDSLPVMREEIETQAVDSKNRLLDYRKRHNWKQ